MAKDKTESTEIPEEPTRSFNVFFARLADGDAHREASAEFHGMIAKLRSLNRMSNGPKAGSLTIVVKVNVDGDIIDLGYDVTAKTPKPPRKKDRAWISKGDNVVYEDPKQMTLKGVRGLPSQNDEAREAGGDDRQARDT